MAALAGSGVEAGTVAQGRLSGIAAILPTTRDCCATMAAVIACRVGQLDGMCCQTLRKARDVPDTARCASDGAAILVAAGVELRPEPIAGRRTTSRGCRLAHASTRTAGHRMRARPGAVISGTTVSDTDLVTNRVFANASTGFALGNDGPARVPLEPPMPDGIGGSTDRNFMSTQPMARKASGT